MFVNSTIGKRNMAFVIQCICCDPHITKLLLLAEQHIFCILVQDLKNIMAFEIIFLRAHSIALVNKPIAVDRGPQQWEQEQIKTANVSTVFPFNFSKTVFLTLFLVEGSLRLHSSFYLRSYLVDCNLLPLTNICHCQTHDQ